jgi:hypothetical protein
LSQQDTPAVDPLTTGYTDAQAKAAMVAAELDEHAPGQWNANWVQVARKAYQVTGDTHYGLLMNMTAPRVGANEIANGQKPCFLNQPAEQIAAEVRGESYSADGTATPIIASIPAVADSSDSSMGM